VQAQGSAMGSCPFPEKRMNVWDVTIEVENTIGDVPWGVGYRSEKFGLISLDDSYIGLSVHPHNSIPYVHTGFNTVI